MNEIIAYESLQGQVECLTPQVSDSSPCSSFRNLALLRLMDYHERQQNQFESVVFKN